MSHCVRWARAPLAAAALLTISFLPAPEASAERRAHGASKEAPKELDAPIEAVFVHPDGARVRRAARVPIGVGTVRIDGLPHALDPGSVRVGALGGEVLGIEWFDTRGADSDREERAALAGKEAELRARFADLGTRETEAQALARHWRALLEAPPDARLLLEDGDRFERWRETAARVRVELETLGRELLELVAEREAVGKQLAELEARRGALGPAEGRRTRAAELRLVWDAGAGPDAGRLTFEYRVTGARWEPSYELRVDPDSQALEVLHRARVRQTSGEDWSGVELELSTARTAARPAPPVPAPIWLRIAEAAGAERGSLPAAGTLARRLRAPEGSEEAASPYAEVVDDGLHLRYRAAGRVDLPSRAQPSEVLIGRARIEGHLVRHALPARDGRVFLRFEGRNTTPWTLLPGPAAVHFGGDFLGEIALGGTPAGAEWELDLGADPSLTVERVPLEDRTREPGFFGSRRTREVAWRLRVTHAGAPDGGRGPIAVRIVEVMPRSGDERVEVRLEGVRPAAAEDERARRLREELGAVTWWLDVPRGGEAEIHWKLVTQWPADRVLVQR